jgi:hypothetical protein
MDVFTACLGRDPLHPRRFRPIPFYIETEMLSF